MNKKEDFLKEFLNWLIVDGGILTILIIITIIFGFTFGTKKVIESIEFREEKIAKMKANITSLKTDADWTKFIKETSGVDLSQEPDIIRIYTSIEDVYLEQDSELIVNYILSKPNVKYKYIGKQYKEAWYSTPEYNLHILEKIK